ncbi:MAG TPA: membrane protein insertase YidC [Gammaproteobacteria bacterium]|nr:membrane protein insertase YidC [Gammaproteobacteria bacterium]
MNSTNMIDYLRIAFYATLIVILLILFQAWDKDFPKAVSAAQPTETVVSNNYVPQITDTAQPINSGNVNPLPAVSHTRLIHITTDLIQVDINPIGGNIVQVKLLQYPEELHSTSPFLLLNNSPDTRYIAQSGLLGTSGPDTTKGQAEYTSDKTDYTLASGQNEIKVNLNWHNADGIKFTKTFIFQRNNYEIGVNYQINNQSQQTWTGNPYLQLMRKNAPPVSKHGFVNFATYFGAAISTPEKAYQKISFKQMDSNNLNQTVKGGWAAMIQHYFVSSWIPDSNTTSQYFTRVTPDGLYTVGMLGQKIQVNPGENATSQAKFYAGPAIAKNLEKVAPGLQLTIDYGWLWFISVIIFWMMEKIHNVIGNWGWAIVIVTVLIKLMFYHLSAKSYRSMSGLKKLQPKINALKERFGDDKQKFTQATLELYKKEKVNPMSGCLPILIQIPVFIALYWVLIESVQLRQAPWILWIHDLSVYDPYYILPILMGLSMLLQQRLNPPPPDPMQAKLMMAMPIFFTILFAKFPAGLMLYWFVNNTLSFLQQWYIMHDLNKSEKSKKT